MFCFGEDVFLNEAGDINSEKTCCVPKLTVLPRRFGEFLVADWGVVAIGSLSVEGEGGIGPKEAESAVEFGVAFDTKLSLERNSEYRKARILSSP